MGRGARRRWGPLKGTEEENDLAALVRTWLDDRGLAVSTVISRFTSDHFTDELLPGRTATYTRLAGEGISWEFVDAVADVITATTTEHQQLLRAARPLWERVLTSVERRGPSRTTDIVATMREMLDISRQLREAQRQLTDLRAEDQSLSWALIMTCQQVLSHMASVRADLEQELARELASSSVLHPSGPPALTWAEARHTLQLLEEWARRIARFSQVLDRPEATGMGPSGSSLGLSEAIETTLRALEAGSAPATRQLSDSASTSVPLSHELREPDPEYTGGGFLRAARLNIERLTPERFLPEDMTDAVMEPDGDRVLTIPMIGLMRQGITIAPGITVLAGPNGVGKSVVLEALSYSLQGERDRRSSGCRPLSRRLAGALEITFHHRPRPQDVWYFSYFGLQPSRNPHLSARESFRALLRDMNSKPGILYMLDEPEAGLAAPLTKDLIAWMDDRVEDGCQFIIATHSMTLASLEHAQVITPGK